MLGGARMRFFAVEAREIGEAEVPQATPVAQHLLTGLESLAVDHDSSPLKITMIDVFTRFEQILAEPEAYGFSDTTTGCIDGPFDSTPCSDPQAVRVFWDEIHPTTQAHRLIAELVDETLSRRELEPELVVPVSTLALYALGVVVLLQGLIMQGDGSFGRRVRRMRSAWARRVRQTMLTARHT